MVTNAAAHTRNRAAQIVLRIGFLRVFFWRAPSRARTRSSELLVGPVRELLRTIGRQPSVQRSIFSGPRVFVAREELIALASLLAFGRRFEPSFYPRCDDFLGDPGIGP